MQNRESEFMSRLIAGLQLKGWPEQEIAAFARWVETGDEQYRPQERAGQPDKRYTIEELLKNGMLDLNGVIVDERYFY